MQVVNLLGEGDNHPSGLKTAHAYELRLPLCDAAKHLDKLADICRETEVRPNLLLICLAIFMYTNRL